MAKICAMGFFVADIEMRLGILFASLWHGLVLLILSPTMYHLEFRLLCYIPYNILNV